MLRVIRSPLLGNSVAILSVALALFLTLLIWPLLQQSALLLFFAAVMMTTRYVGVRPGLLATILAVLGIDYFFTPPIYALSLDLGSVLRGGIFVLAAFFVGLLNVVRDRANKALQDTYQTLQAVIQASPLAITILDDAGKVRMWNPAARRIFGWTGLEILGHSLPIIPPDQREEFQEQCKAILQRAAFSTIETRWLQKDGAFLDVSIWMAPIRNAEGEIGGLMLIAADITECKQSAEEQALLLACAQAACTEAEAAHRIKDEFLANLSHELRAPLNSIQGWTRMLRSIEPDEDTLDQALEVIERNTQFQTRLIEDLLDISQIASGKLRLRTCSVNASTVIEATIAAIHPAIEAKKIQLKSILDPAVGIVSADPDRLQQVVWNLLSNAIKFTPEHGSVEVRLEPIDHQIQISVRDTGRGISAELLPYIFDRFRQAEGAKPKDGSGLGLGLAIVRYLVELHGGTVQADSRGEGQGATFIVKLPLRDLWMKVGDEKPAQGVAFM